MKRWPSCGTKRGAQMPARTKPVYAEDMSLLVRAPRRLLTSRGRRLILH